MPYCCVILRAPTVRNCVLLGLLVVLGCRPAQSPDVAAAAEGPAAQGGQQHLVAGRPAVKAPVDLVREIGELLKTIDSHDSALQQRLALDGRLLALRKQLPDWERPHGAVRAMLAPQGPEALGLCDRTRGLALQLLEQPEVSKLLGAYLKQIEAMLAEPA